MTQVSSLNGVTFLTDGKDELPKHLKEEQLETLFGNSKESTTAHKKDLWDKMAAIGPIISGICVFSIGGFFTYVYNQQQLRVQEVQTIEKFLPRLAGDEQSKRAAILAISSLTNTELASKMAAIYASAGTASALQSMAQSGSEKDKSIASEALAQTLEKIANNQNKLKDIEQDLKIALAQPDTAGKSGTSHAPDLTYNLSKLADLYALQGQYDLAEPLLKRSLALREDMYGASNPQVVDVLKSLAEVSKMRGSKSQADAYLLRAREIEASEGQERKPAIATHQNEFKQSEPDPSNSLTVVNGSNAGVAESEKANVEASDTNKVTEANGESLRPSDNKQHVASQSSMADRGEDKHL